MRDRAPNLVRDSERERTRQRRADNERLAYEFAVAIQLAVEEPDLRRIAQRVDAAARGVQQSFSYYSDQVQRVLPYLNRRSAEFVTRQSF